MEQESGTPVTHYAHSKPGVPRDEWQDLSVHLRNVAELAAGMMPPKSAVWGRLAGMWHDLGKYSNEFQRRIGAEPLASAETQPLQVDHSSAGAQHAYQTLGDLGLFLSYVIAGHHAGLPNFWDESEANLRTRLKKAVPEWSAAPPGILDPGKLGTESLPFNPDKNRLGIQVFLFTRLLFSALVDADFLDTEAFYDPAATSQRAAAWSLLEMKAALDTHLEELVRRASRSPGASPQLNEARASVLDACRVAAVLEPGLFSLTVPTGGGKTLSSLAFGLDHAIRHGLERVIYVIPYTSIIEQTAAVFRGVFGARDGKSPVLEHHSNYESEREHQWDRLASENWDAPLIVTTGVQFFESLFAAKVSRSRRVHNIARSVVILDEAQFLPPGLMLPTLRVIEELSVTYGVTFVFCTATQPALNVREDFGDGLAGIREIVPHPDALFSALRRTTVHFVGNQEPDETARQIASHKQVLAVVNTRAGARDLYERVVESGSNTDQTLHLSARMYPRHRSIVLQRARARLRSAETVRVVSTQLIEAGVDIDFPVVYRELAGLDSIAQSAGRCNREGRASEPGDVFVFRSNGRSIPTTFRAAVDAMLETKDQHQDLLRPDAVETYFRNLYWRKSISGGLDAEGILRLLRSSRAAQLVVPFRKVADAYKLIDNPMRAVVADPGIKRPEADLVARELEADSQTIRALLSNLNGRASANQLARALQRYTVQVYEFEFQAMVQQGAVQETMPGVWVLSNPAAYDVRLGLTPESSGIRVPDQLIC